MVTEADALRDGHRGPWSCWDTWNAAYAIGSFRGCQRDSEAATMPSRRWMNMTEPSGTLLLGLRNDDAGSSS